ncbi:hypothetical protein INCEPTION_5 [Proteus phage vB_PmiS_Inception]|nr:hypothetical protein INCEPTION_5 [Proteus phage vB_PmiS_Inception]
MVPSAASNPAESSSKMLGTSDPGQFIQVAEYDGANIECPSFSQANISRCKNDLSILPLIQKRDCLSNPYHSVS